MNQNLLLILIVVIVVFYLLKKNEHFVNTSTPYNSTLLTAFNNQTIYFKNRNITPPHSQVYTDNTSLQILVKKNDDFIKKNTPTVQYNNSLTTTNFNLEPTITTVLPQCPANYTDSNGNLVTYSYNAFTGMCHGYNDRGGGILPSINGDCKSNRVKYRGTCYNKPNPGFSCDPNLPHMCSTDITPIPK